MPLWVPCRPLRWSVPSSCFLHTGVTWRAPYHIPSHKGASKYQHGGYCSGRGACSYSRFVLTLGTDRSPVFCFWLVIAEKSTNGSLSWLWPHSSNQFNAMQQLMLLVNTWFWLIKMYIYSIFCLLVKQLLLLRWAQKELVWRVCEGKVKKSLILYSPVSYLNYCDIIVLDWPKQLNKLSLASVQINDSKTFGHHHHELKDRHSHHTTKQNTNWWSWFLTISGNVIIYNSFVSTNHP